MEITAKEVRNLIQNKASVKGACSEGHGRLDARKIKEHWGEFDALPHPGGEALFQPEAGLRVERLRRQPQLVVMDEGTRCRHADIGHHIGLRPCPELPVAVPVVHVV